MIKYKFYRNKITTLIRHSKKLYYHTYFTQYMNDMKKTWTGINEIMSRDKRKSKPIVGLKRLNGNGVTHNVAELPNVLNDFFSTVGQKLASNIPDANCRYKEYLANANFTSSFFFEPVISADIELEISLLPSNKAYGLYATMAATRVMFGSVNFKSFWTRICSVLLVLFLVLVPHRQDNLTSKSCRFSRANSCETSTFKSTDDALSFHVPSKHTRRRTFTVLKVPHNTGAISSFQLRLKSGDIHPNPGPAKRKTVKHPCGECLCNVRNNQDAILCGECQRWFHAKCINMGKATFKYYLENYSLPWTCLFCSLPKLSDSFFDQSSGDSDILRNFSQEAKLESDVIVVDHLAQTASKLASAPKDLRVAHYYVDAHSLILKINANNYCTL